MGLNLKITEKQILEGNTSEIRKEIENIRQSSGLIKRYEDGVSLIFLENTPFDMVKKIKTDTYREWFRKLNVEIPGLPYFLSAKTNSLLFFIMGNVTYFEEEDEIRFDKIESSRFLKEKVAQIRNICLAHNINPQPGINRISKIMSGGSNQQESPEVVHNKNEAISPEKNEPEKPEKKGTSIKNFLDKYSSIAFINNNRVVKLALVVEEIPAKISFTKNLLVKDPTFPQPFFITEIQTDSGIQEIRSVIIPTLSDIESSISHNNGVYIQVLVKAEDGTYQRLFESDTPFSVEIVTDFVSRKSEEPAPEEENEEKESVSPEQSIDKTEEKSEEEPEEASIEPEPQPAENIEPAQAAAETDNPYLEISKLRKEREELIEQVQKLQNLVQEYEEEINKKRSIKGFFGKFFN